MNSYRKLSITLLISFVLMYAVMFLNMDRLEHYHNSVTRAYMAVLMVAPMALVMLLMMGKMYPNKKLNRVIMVAAVLVFSLFLIGLRTQTPVNDVQYMKAMIPHHSSAIMTSKHANISDPEVRALADSIIASQEREIRQMEAILHRMSGQE